METKIIIVSILIAVVVSTTISLTASNFLPDFLQAYARKTLNEDDVAQTILVRITNDDGMEKAYDSFSRIGFVRGSGIEFLLESLPSKDKKSFYEHIGDSLNSPFAKTLDIHIDVFSGDGTLIETLNYKKCIIDSYFLHVNDSKGKFSFLDEGSSNMEIREVTKFECAGLSITV